MVHHTRADGRTDLPRVAKPAQVRRLGTVDVAELRAHVGRVSEKVWRQEDADKENDYLCFTHTRHIVFRFIHRNRTPLHYYSNPIWTVWQRLLLPVMARLGYLSEAEAFLNTPAS